MGFCVLICPPNSTSSRPRVTSFIPVGSTTTCMWMTRQTPSPAQVLPGASDPCIQLRTERPRLGMPRRPPSSAHKETRFPSDLILPSCLLALLGWEVGVSPTPRPLTRPPPAHRQASHLSPSCLVQHLLFLVSLSSPPTLNMDTWPPASCPPSTPCPLLVPWGCGSHSPAGNAARAPLSFRDNIT